MTQLYIIDGNNWARRGFAVGRTVRQMWSHVWESCQVGPVFVIWDGFDSRAPRRALFPDYKAQRGKAGEEIYDAMNYLKKMIRLTAATTLEIPEIEADDVIADIAMKWHGPVAINTNDVDLAAIDRSDLIITEDIKIPCDCRDLRLYKTLVGDSADNIKGLTGFGPGSFEKLTASDRATLIQAFQAEDKVALAEYLQAVVPARCKKWLDGNDNVDLLFTYWNIIGFLPVPTPSPEHIAYGTPDLSAAERIFEQFLDADPHRPSLARGASLDAFGGDQRG